MTKFTDKIKKIIIKNSKDLQASLKSPVKNKVRAKKAQEIAINIVKYVILYGLSFIIIYPILQQLSIAFRSLDDLNNPAVIWVPEHFSLNSFKIVSKAMEYPKALFNTFWISSLVTIGQVISASLAGYAFARLKFRGNNVVFALVLFTIVVPPSTISLANYIYLGTLDLLGKPVALILMSFLGMGIKSGVFIFIFRQFFRGIPVELEEAAQVDGANVFKTFYKVMLPNARGALLTVGLFAFVWQWNDSYFSSLFLSGVNVDVPVLTHALTSMVWGLINILYSLGIYDLIGTDVTQNPLFVSAMLNTAAIMVMAPLLIMYLFVQRLFIEGVERTGIVG